MIIEISDDAPQVWKDLVTGLALLSKGATSSYPTHCEHDELTVCADPHQFTREERAKLDELGFFVDGHDSDEDEGQGTVEDCDGEYCDAAFKSFKYGSA